MITEKMLKEAKAIAPFINEDTLRRIMIVGQQPETPEEVIDHGTKLSVSLPTLKDADSLGHVSWCRSGVWMIGTVMQGPPVDATRWRWTDRKKNASTF